MRISEREKNILVGAVLTQDPSARVWLFGSRANDGKRGGDIDIAVSTDGMDPFFRQAMEKGVRIDE
jgi:predicted nucleotidyltransferase